MLSAQLKELEKDGLLIRKEYPQIPPKVEYSMNKIGYDCYQCLMNYAIGY